MAKRPTIEQLAAAAGVSVATVDRVLNRRLPVRAGTARRVQEAAERIGFHAASLIGARVREDLPERRLGFLLLRTGGEFYPAFARTLESAVTEAAAFRGTALFEHASPQDPDEVVAKLRSLGARAQAVAVVAPEHPALAAEVERLRAAGVPVFALLSDFAPALRQAYVGVDNRKVGRTAAWMIARVAREPGPVALFVGSHRFGGHELREIGFRAFFRERAPHFTVLDTLVNGESADFTRDALAELAARHGRLAGVYVAGSGMEGAVAALRALPPERRPVAVCNEITPTSRAALAAEILSMVIATPIQPLSRELVRLMAEAAGPAAARPAPAQLFLPFDVFLPENV